MENWQARLTEILEYEIRVAGHVVNPADWVIRLLAVLVIFMVARSVARRIRGLHGHRLFSRVEAGPRYTIIRLIQYLIYTAGVVVALQALKINLTALAVAFGALGVGAGLGLQSVVANFVAGLVLLFERPIKVHDYVSTENVEGRVMEIRFRSTLIQTNDNISIILPNSELTGRSLINWSHGDSDVRIQVPVGVAYGSDVELVTKALLEVAARTEGVLKSPEPHVWFESFGDSSLNFVLLAWTADPVRHRRIRSRLNYAIDAAFRKYGVHIPFPQRDVHVRSAEGLAGLGERGEPPGSDS